MKIFRFVEKVFFIALAILSNFVNALNAIPLSCISMKNQECKQDHMLSILIVTILYFTLLVSK